MFRICLIGSQSGFSRPSIKGHLLRYTQTLRLNVLKSTPRLIDSLRAVLIVLSLSPTGSGNGAGHAGERIGRIKLCDVDERDDSGGGEILRSSSPEERALQVHLSQRSVEWNFGAL
jgi:hypothetical protein